MTRCHPWFGTAWYTLFALSPPILRLPGWFPDNGHPSLLPLLVGAALIGGVGVVQALMLRAPDGGHLDGMSWLPAAERGLFGALTFRGGRLGIEPSGARLDVLPAKAILERYPRS